MPPERDRRLVRRGRVVEGAALDFERTVNFREKIRVKFPCAVVRVDCPQFRCEFGIAADDHARRTARPLQEFHEPLDVAEVQRGVRCGVRERRKIEARHRAIGPCECDGERFGCGDAAAAELTVPQRGMDDAGIERRSDRGGAAEHAAWDSAAAVFGEQFFAAMISACALVRPSRAQGFRIRGCSRPSATHSPRP